MPERFSDEELLANYARAYSRSDPCVSGKGNLPQEDVDELCRVTNLYRFLVLRRMKPNLKEFWKVKE